MHHPNSTVTCVQAAHAQTTGQFFLSQSQHIARAPHRSNKALGVLSTQTLDSGRLAVHCRTTVTTYMKDSLIPVVCNAHLSTPQSCVTASTQPVHALGWTVSSSALSCLRAHGLRRHSERGLCLVLRHCHQTGTRVWGGVLNRYLAGFTFQGM